MPRAVLIALVFVALAACSARDGVETRVSDLPITEGPEAVAPGDLVVRLPESPLIAGMRAFRQNRPEAYTEMVEAERVDLVVRVAKAEGMYVPASLRAADVRQIVRATDDLGAPDDWQEIEVRRTGAISHTTVDVDDETCVIARKPLGQKHPTRNVYRADVSGVLCSKQPDDISAKRQALIVLLSGIELRHDLSNL